MKFDCSERLSNLTHQAVDALQTTVMGAAQSVFGNHPNGRNSGNGANGNGYVNGNGFMRPYTSITNNGNGQDEMGFSNQQVAQDFVSLWRNDVFVVICCKKNVVLFTLESHFSVRMGKRKISRCFRRITTTGNYKWNTSATRSSKSSLSAVKSGDCIWTKQSK